MKSHLRTPFLYHLILVTCLLHVLQACYCQDQDDFRRCNGHYICGNVTGVWYPFWGGARPRYCGRQEFKIKCVGNNCPRFNIGAQMFHVRKIDQMAYTMRIARWDISVNICSNKNGTFTNTTLNHKLLDYASTVRNISLYYGCSFHATRRPWNSFICRISGMDSVGYFVDEASTGFNGLITQNCSVKTIVPLLQENFEALFRQQMSLHEAVKGGFDVTYHADREACADCENKYGICGSNKTSPFVCHIEDYNTHSIPTFVTVPMGTDPALNISIGSNITIALFPLLLAFILSSSRAHMSRYTGIASTVGVVLFVCMACFLYRRRPHQTSSSEMTTNCLQKRGSDQNVEKLIGQCASFSPKRYRYSDIRKMTNFFGDKLGHGGCGSVYKGRLIDGRLVAVKVLNTSKGKGEEFVNEVASISQTSHVNVVSLLGFCFEGEKRALVYEFMANGSLEKFIDNGNASKHGQRLGWEKLYQIAVGIARGLEYLHQGCNTRILHFDIKPHNILLDEDFCPKISDFGLAKLCSREKSIISMKDTRGTIGYIAPEVFSRNFGGVSHKSDVYSYGMMVLEMVGGRKAADNGVDNMSNEYFPQWVYKRLQLGQDMGLQYVMNEKENEVAKKMVIMGLWCIQTNPSNRPSIKEALDMLEGSVDALKVPPKPFICSTANSPVDPFYALTLDCPTMEL